MSDAGHVIRGADKVIAHEGVWPTLHDAKVQDIAVDCLAETVEITFDLCDYVAYPQERTTLLGLRWHGAQRFDLHTTNIGGVLRRVTFTGGKGGVNTTFTAATGGMEGQIVARQVEVTRYEPAT